MLPVLAMVAIRPISDSFLKMFWSAPWGKSENQDRLKVPLSLTILICL